jgi:hypothetical protein
VLCQVVERVKLHFPNGLEKLHTMTRERGRKRKRNRWGSTRRNGDGGMEGKFQSTSSSDHYHACTFDTRRGKDQYQAV